MLNSSINMVKEGQPVTIRAQLRELVYSHVFGETINKQELQLLVDAGEAEARSMKSGSLIMDGSRVVGSKPLIQYPEDVVKILARFNMTRLNDSLVGNAARSFLEPLVGRESLGFYVGIMRLGLGAGSPNLTHRAMASDYGVSVANIRREERNLIDKIKSL